LSVQNGVLSNRNNSSTTKLQNTPPQVPMDSVVHNCNAVGIFWLCVFTLTDESPKKKNGYPLALPHTKPTAEAEMKYARPAPKTQLAASVAAAAAVEAGFARQHRNRVALGRFALINRVRAVTDIAKTGSPS